MKRRKILKWNIHDWIIDQTILLPVNTSLAVKGKLIKDYSHLDSFVIYLCLSGDAEISLMGIHKKYLKGQALLIPAEVVEVHISSTGADLLEVFVV